MALENNMPLHVAAANGLKFKVIRLCVNSELVNEANSVGWTPIMYAAYYGHFDIVKDLLTLGADVSLQNSFGGCIYTLAATSGNVEIIRALYSHHKIPPEKLIKPLAAAVVFGHLSVVRFLIDSGADPNSSMEYSGVMPLMLAVIENHVEIVKFMVHRGADIVSQNCAGYSALQLAKITGNKIIMSIFSEKLGYNIESLPVYASCKNKEAVVQAATSGDVFSLKSLLSRNPSLSTSQHWMSILNEENVKNIGDDDVFVSFEDEKHSVKLKQNNAFCHNTFPAFAGRNNRVGRGDMFGFCYGPYTSSFQYDCSEIRQLGMRNRKYASVNAEINSLAKITPGSEYSLPVKSPIRSDNSKEVVNSLKRGVKSILPSSDSGLVRFERNSSEENKMVTSPLILACFNGHVEATRLLIAAGADPNRQRKGRTPLMVAAITSNIEVVQLLLSAGADPLVESHVDSLTAFELASLSGAETELLRLIASYALPISWDESQSAKPPLLLDPPLKPDCWISPQRILSKLHSLVPPRLQNDSYSWGSGHLWDSKKSKEWMVSPLQK
ncbi:serine/threonine-protein phosphatase 6 regulatory ankyrin repeat subunit A-like [Hetaerina americana]|uniref:serine/threonine-protein phosphatase 6 regulatory ankyrin repeat subunit A-like n=1 Tax=Hetaerina americana TaxID=62018 RepID=UPI003A7F3CAE